MMTYQEYLSTMKEIQTRVLLFLEKEDNIEENFENVVKYLSDQKKLNNKEELKSVLYLLANISANHNRGRGFIDKISQILDYFKSNIKKIFTEDEIFDIFENCLLIILFLYQNRFINIDTIYLNMDNFDFFLPEISAKYNDKSKSDEIPKDFYEKRKIGENDDYICKLIREDLIDEFISYVNQKSYPLNSEIKPSIFETNSFLIINKPTLIDYAAFFGSVQIFRYLYKNDVELNPRLWLYGIHSDNPEIISILEDEKVAPYKGSHENSLFCSIKCHHIDMTNYILNNFLNERVISKNIKDNFYSNIYSYSFESYNFSFFPDGLSNRFLIYYACKFDNYPVVNFILKKQNVDFSEKAILKINLFVFIIFLTKLFK